MASAVRTQRDGLLVLSPLASLYSVKDQSSWEGATSIQGGSFHLINPVWKPPHRHPQRFVSWVILGPIKLTILTFMMPKYPGIWAHLLDTAESQQAMAVESVGSRHGGREGSDLEALGLRGAAPERFG